jgi:hypothetical protein
VSGRGCGDGDLVRHAIRLVRQTLGPGQSANWLTCSSSQWHWPRSSGCSSMVEQKPSKLTTRVRFPSPAPRRKPREATWHSVLCSALTRLCRAAIWRACSPCSPPLRTGCAWQPRGEVAEWLKAADCKSARASVRWFESSPLHHPCLHVAAEHLKPATMREASGRRCPASAGEPSKCCEGYGILARPNDGDPPLLTSLQLELAEICRKLVKWEDMK